MSNNLIKIDIINHLNKKTGFSKIHSNKIVNDLIDIILENIKTGQLNIKNIGSFKVISKKQRLGRNPKTKKEYVISQRKTVSFAPSKFLLKDLNKIL